MRGTGVDLGPHALGDADEGGDLARDREAVADRVARLQAAGQPDHRHPRLARGVGERAAGGRGVAARADGLGGGEAGERLLGVARVARAEDRAVGRGPGGQLVVAEDQHRHRHGVAHRGAREHPADRGAAHAADDQPAGVLGLEPGRLDPPERVAQVIREREHVVELTARVDRLDRVQAHSDCPNCDRARPGPAGLGLTRPPRPRRARRAGRASRPRPSRRPRSWLPRRSRIRGRSSPPRRPERRPRESIR